MTGFAELQALTNFTFLEAAPAPSWWARPSMRPGGSPSPTTTPQGWSAPMPAKAMGAVIPVRLDLVAGERRRSPPLPASSWPRDRAAYGRLTRLVSRPAPPKNKCILTLDDGGIPERARCSPSCRRARTNRPSWPSCAIRAGSSSRPTSRRRAARRPASGRGLPRSGTHAPHPLIAAMTCSPPSRPAHAAGCLPASARMHPRRWLPARRQRRCAI